MKLIKQITITILGVIILCAPIQSSTKQSGASEIEIESLDPRPTKRKTPTRKS